MPMPIRPIGDPYSTSRNETESQDLFTMNLDALAGAAAIGGINRSSSIRVHAEACDEDAELLLELFNRSTIVAEAEEAEDKKYSVPDDFSGDKLLRLKAARLVSGDAHIIQFTNKAARVIKTLVLSEQNAYTKTAVKKPYSVILAENKAKSANRSTLAFERTASAVVTAQRNMPIDQEYMPTRETPYVSSTRLVLNEGTSNKQYIVRVFNVGGRYSVLAWNGRNKIGRALAMQPKGTFVDRAQAMGVAQDLVSSKTREGYSYARAIDHPSLLGTESPPAAATEAPRPTRAPRTVLRLVPRVNPRPAATPPAAPTDTPPAATAPAPKPAAASPETKKPAIETLPIDQYIETLMGQLEDDNDIDI